jgi:hypothetical protein
LSVVVVGLTVTGACSTDHGEKAERAERDEAAEQTTTSAGTNTTVEAPEDTGNVPAPVVTIEAQAEDIIDVVPEGAWSKVAADIDKTATAWNSYRAQATHDGASEAIVSRFDTALAALRTAATGKHAAETMQAANDLSGVVVDLYGLYHPPVPIDVSRFDVIGRQVILDLDRNDLAGAGSELDRIASTWSALKAEIVSHKGAAVAAQTDDLLAAMRGAHQRGDTKTLRTKTADFLEIVDRMEELYEKA